MVHHEIESGLVGGTMSPGPGGSWGGGGAMPGLEIRLRVRGNVPEPLFYFVNFRIDSHLGD